MKWDKFRRSENVEDFTDPSKPVPPSEFEGASISETLKLQASGLAHDVGIDADLNKVKVEPIKEERVDDASTNPTDKGRETGGSA